MKEEKPKNKLEIEKIIVGTEDELIDILKAIEESKAEKIILTFAENSDILISPINLKVILETADELQKPLIALIVQNPVGVRNAREIGMTVTETSGSILDSFWDEALASMGTRTRDKEESLKRKRSSKKEETTVDEVVSEDAKHPEQLEAELQGKSEFQKRIEVAIDKAKEDPTSKKKLVNDNGVILAIDGDVNETKQNSIIGKIYKGFKPKEVPVIEEKVEKPKEEVKVAKPKKKFVFPKINLPKISLPKSSTVLVLKIVLPIVALLGLSAWLAYTMMPLVKIKIYVESKQVSTEKTFSGDPEKTTFDLQNGIVPVKRETVQKSSSNSAKATGTAYKGTKAEGVLTFVYWNYPITHKAIELPAGTKVTSSKGLIFTTNIAATIGFGSVDVPITASAVGEEYNLIKGDFFTVDGYASSELSAQNSDSDIAGGTKTAYTVFSKGDLDKAVESMKKTLFTESEGELADKEVDGWALVEGGLKKELDGDPETDIPVGAEADNVNVTIKTEVSSLFYMKGQIESSINQMLTDKANSQNLFEGINGQLLLDENVEKSIEVTSVKKDVVKVLVKASSWIRPDVDKNALIDEIKGKGWAEGQAILSSKSFSAQQPEFEFQPANFPEWLKHFPTRQGRIYITIQEVDSSPEVNN